MGYRYETHAHTREASACASAGGKEMARAYWKLGYTGLFITDHFFNGNTAIPENLPWKERISLFCSGYENAKEEGQRLGLQVFFGMEYGVGTADFLIYNLDPKWLLAHEDIHRENPKTAFRIMHEDGAFIVQAHPFRQRAYIDSILLFPWDTDAVEIINGAHEGAAECDAFAEQYAKMYRLAGTSGADSHNLDRIYACGVETDRKFSAPCDYRSLILSGKARLLHSGAMDLREN